MSQQTDSLAVALFSEILTVDQLARNNVAKVLPRGMELSHFSVLNHLAHTQSEKTPAQLAQTFHLTRGAMTNTLRKLETSGYVHIRPDWDDARRKLVTISPAGRAARDAALAAIVPIIADAVEKIGADKMARDLTDHAGTSIGTQQRRLSGFERCGDVVHRQIAIGNRPAPAQKIKLEPFAVHRIETGLTHQIEKLIGRDEFFKFMGPFG